jgi:CheY-like chemotaxis protein
MRSSAASSCQPCVSSKPRKNTCQVDISGKTCYHHHMSTDNRGEPNTDTENPIKILIVEDESITAMDIAHTLRGWGWDVVGTAASGVDAIEQAASFRPDVVLMDIRLKGIMDGISTATRIQNRLNIPVIYITAHSDDDSVKRAHYSGAYGYIVKPIKPEELREAILRALSRHRARRHGGSR